MAADAPPPDEVESTESTESPPPTRPTLPADPAAYDEPRNVQARARGLSAPYIAGGRDPDAETAAAEDRRLRRILIAFVVLVVLSGFVLGAIGTIVGGPR
jgi:hypothetical protein